MSINFIRSKKLFDAESTTFPVPIIKTLKIRQTLCLFSYV